MKKYLLGTMMLVGALAYGQGNKVVVPVDATGHAETTLNLEVEGKVFDQNQRSLVVEIKSAATPDGRGFSFQMPDLFKTEKGTNVTGNFVASIQTNGNKEELKNGAFEINLLNNQNAKLTKIEGATTVGTALGTTLNYTLTGVTNKVEHAGTINVQALAGNEVGSYSDNTVKLEIIANNN